jgi:VWFA-related protein
MKVARFLICLLAGTVGSSPLLFSQRPSQSTDSAQDPAPKPAMPDRTAPTPSSAPASADSAEDESVLFRASVHNITAPVTVLDKSGAIVDGIESGRFHLYDNGKQQNIHVDISVQPISLVIAVQQSDRVDAVLNQIHKIGPMVQPLLTGDTGEAAVISFDSRIQIKQDFTNDADVLQKAIQNIHSGNTPSRMIDAVEKGVQMLRNRPANRRRIILLISETRDMSSEARLRETLIAAQLNNVTVYTVDISRIVTSLTAKPQPPAVDPMPAAAYNLPGPGPTTPTSVAQAYQVGNRAEFVPLLKELYMGTKRIFVDNPAEVFTEQTGGAQFTFKKERGLEDAISSLGREIHSQYLITYAPDDTKTDGFHQIRVDVDLPDLIVRTRPGYFLAGLNAK